MPYFSGWMLDVDALGWLRLLCTCTLTLLSADLLTAVHNFVVLEIELVSPIFYVTPCFAE
jgi:hypothetical protein